MSESICRSMSSRHVMVYRSMLSSCLDIQLHIAQDYIYTYMHACMHACIHTDIHTYTHAYIHIEFSIPSAPRILPGPAFGNDFRRIRQGGGGSGQAPRCDRLLFLSDSVRIIMMPVVVVIVNKIVNLFMHA